MPKTQCMSHARMVSFYPGMYCVFRHFSCACIAYFGFWSALQTLQVLRMTGWKPAFILLLCRTTTVGGRGRVCWSVRRRLSVWTSVGRSAQVLGIVTHRIPAVLCSSQYQMRVSSETGASMSSVLSTISLPSTLPWNSTQHIAVVVTSESLGQWTVT